VPVDVGVGVEHFRPGAEGAVVCFCCHVLADSGVWVKMWNALYS
jgi:hypothetical protein